MIRREIGGYGEIPEERCFSERWEKFGEDGLYRFIVDPVACPTSGVGTGELNDFEDEDDQTVDQTEPGFGVTPSPAYPPTAACWSSISADVRLVKLFDERTGSLVECAVPGAPSLSRGVHSIRTRFRPTSRRRASGTRRFETGSTEGNANGIFESTFARNTPAGQRGCRRG